HRAEPTATGGRSRTLRADASADLAPVVRALPLRCQSATRLGVCGLQAGCLGALAECPGDGVGGRVYFEFGFQVREPISDCVQAEAQLPRDVRFFLYRGGGPEHLRLARGQAEAIERVRAEACDLLLEHQRVRIAGQQVDGEAPPVPDADER